MDEERPINDSWNLVIMGNHDTSHGNPIPYERMTQKTKWLARNKRYFRWKQYILQCWLEKYHRYPDFAPGDTYRLDVICYFKGENHADPENVRKGVQDALFSNDKHIWGLVGFRHASEPAIYIKVRKESPPATDAKV